MRPNWLRYFQNLNPLRPWRLATATSSPEASRFSLEKGKTYVAYVARFVAGADSFFLLRRLEKTLKTRLQGTAVFAGYAASITLGLGTWFSLVDQESARIHLLFQLASRGTPIQSAGRSES